ncbi:hypothetical protein J6590_032527 [Homalodisca vitripennis]|nr:hypothetical protein J6590_032527 [Homalodisca vitripennis]
MRCKSWGRQREIDNMCSQKLCSKTSIRFCSPNIPGTRETQKRRPRPSSISIGRLSSRALVRPGPRFLGPFGWTPLKRLRLPELTSIRRRRHTAT